MARRRRQGDEAYASHGWMSDHHFDHVDRFVGTSVNFEGPRAYERAYREALRLQQSGNTREEIITSLHDSASPLQPNAKHIVTVDMKAWHELHKELASIRLRAINDALDGRPMSYES